MGRRLGGSVAPSELAAVLRLQGLLRSPLVLRGGRLRPRLFLPGGEDGVEDDASEVDEAGDEEDGLPLSGRLQHSTGQLSQPGNIHTGTGKLRQPGNTHTGTGQLSQPGKTHTGTGKLRQPGTTHTGTGQLSQPGNTHTGTGQLSQPGNTHTGTGQLSQPGNTYTAAGQLSQPGNTHTVKSAFFRLFCQEGDEGERKVSDFVVKREVTATERFLILLPRGR